MASIPNWVWYNSDDTYPLATSNEAGSFQSSIIGTTVDLSTYTEDASLEDANEDGRIDDVDRFPATDTPEFDPPADEGITIAGDFRQIQTFASFETTFVTTDGESLSVPVVAYQFSDGSVAFRLDNVGSAILNDQGIFRNDVQSITFTSFNNYFRSAGNAGHSGAFAPCYTPGTMILTSKGEIAVENLRVGDLVGTPEHGFHPIKWIGCRDICFSADGSLDQLRPVRVHASSFGTGARDLTVSPQHRILARSRLTRRMFGADEVLVPAIAMVQSGRATRIIDTPSVTYIHFMCDNHQIVHANGIPSESLYLGRQARLALGQQAVTEIFEIFPHLLNDIMPSEGAMFAKRRKAERMFSRLEKNGTKVNETLQ